jgi:multidrug efflux pump subunit AcrB
MCIRDRAGRIQEDREAANKQTRNYILALAGIYSLLALSLRSYFQPIMIMSVIPFGIVGAVFGHMLFGMDMSALSLFGIIAVSGVVVNDSLVLVNFINRTLSAGANLKQAVVVGVCKRFRAVMLTSITTFFGLIPIIFETSMQAKIVIPMAVSLAFGVLFATLITIVLIPCLYVIVGDIYKVFTGKKYYKTVSRTV